MIGLNSWIEALLASCLVAALAGCGNDNTPSGGNVGGESPSTRLISPAEIKELWEAGVSRDVFCFTTGQEFVNDWSRWQGVPPYWKFLEEEGYVTLTTDRLRFGQPVPTWTSLGLENSYASRAGKEERCFVVGKLTIDKIVDRSAGGQVLIAGSHSLNALGATLWPDSDEVKTGQQIRYRFQLTVQYDPFLERFLLLKVRYSPWNKEEWEPTYRLVDDGKGELIAEL